MKTLIMMIALLASQVASASDVSLLGLPTYNGQKDRHFEMNYGGTLTLSSGHLEVGALATQGSIYCGSLGLTDTNEDGTGAFGALVGTKDQYMVGGLYVRHTVLNSAISVGTLVLAGPKAGSYGLTVGFTW